MRELWVDFNTVDGRGYASTLAKFAEQNVSLSLGMQVVVGDDDGQLCDAVVVSIGEDGVVVVALDLGTMHRNQRAARVAV